MGDHVPLQFLLGTRAHRYLDHHRRFGPSPKEISMFLPSEHPRIREREARTMLERVLQDRASSGSNEIYHEGPSSTRYAVEEGEKAAIGTTVPQRQKPEIKKTGLHALSDSAPSYHGYRLENPQFLGIDGIVKVPLVANIGQASEMKAAKAKRAKHEMRKRKEMQSQLRQQQLNTKDTENRLKSIHNESKTTSLKKHDLETDCGLADLTTEPFGHLKSSSLAHLDSSQNSWPSNGATNTQSAPILVPLSDSNQYDERQHDKSSRKETMGFVREQKRVLARFTAPRPTYLSTLKLDERSERTEDEPCTSGSTMNRQFSELGFVDYGTTAIKFSRRRQDNSRGQLKDNKAAVASGRECAQRELFGRSEFGGKYLGGGYSVKKKEIDACAESCTAFARAGLESSDVESLLEVQMIQKVLPKVSGGR